MTTEPIAIPDPVAASEPAAAPRPPSHGGLLLVLVGIAVVMVAFAFVVLPPLYSLFCRTGGSEMNPNNPAVANAVDVPTGRFVEVFFEGKVFDQLKVRFAPETTAQRVEVGSDSRNVYRLQNLSDETIHFRAIHQVDPGVIQQHFGMKVCFCFQDQELGPGEERELPVVYRFDPAMDARVQDVTICYSLLAQVPGESKAGSLDRLKQAGGLSGAVVTPGYTAEDLAEPVRDAAPASAPAPTP
jgi:cytochrome c oxidase assembly protein subunit 11